MNKIYTTIKEFFATLRASWHNARERALQEEARRIIRLEMMDDQEYWLLYDDTKIINTEQMSKDPWKVLMDARRNYVERRL